MCIVHQQTWNAHVPAIDCVFPLDCVKSWEISPDKKPEKKQMVLQKIVFTYNAIWSQSTPMSYLKSVNAFKVFNPGRFGLITFRTETRTHKLMSTCHCLFASGLLPRTQRPRKILTYRKMFWEVCSNTTYNSCPFTCQTFTEYLLSTRNYHWRWFVPWSSIWCHLGNRHQFDVMYEVDTSEWFKS